ncbi:MAG: metallophosphoesterase [Eubacteriales bacterium]|nr:metallophosphoesterase [Eubacteriales bacterium]
MRALVIADSHGSPGRVAQALAQAGKVDLLIHCGDGALDVEGVRGIAPCILQVRGNCDYAPELPSRCLTQEEGVRILIVHGHEQGVKSDLQRLEYTAQEAGAQVVCFGHTHMPLIDRQGELLLVNPGSLRASRPTYAVVTAEKGKYDARTFFLFVGEKRNKD